MPGSADSAISPKKRKGLFSKLPVGRRYVVFYVIVFFLLAILVVSCWLLGTSAARHSLYEHRHRDAKTALLISTAVSAAGEEAIALSLGKPCSEVCGHLDSKLRDLEKVGSKINLNMPEIRSYIQQGRDGYAGNDGAFSAAMSAYNRATYVMIDGLRVLMGKQADKGYAVQVGLLCILEPLIPAFNRFTIQYPPLLARWGLEQYRVYMGSTMTDYNFPTCAPYIPGVATVDLPALVANGPKVTNLPTLGTSGIPEFEEATLQKGLSQVTQLAEVYGTQTKDYWKKQMVKLGATIALSTLSAAIALVSLCFVPSFISAKASRSDAAIHAQYHKVDSKAKLFPQFAHYISTLKGESHLHTFLQDSFLIKIEGFVDRVRPLIPQTCFGDIEAVAFTDTGDVAQSKEESGFGNGGVSGGGGCSEEEHRVQELRGEVGLQVASGVYLCVASAAHIRGDKTAMGEERQRALTERMGSLVTGVEEIVNARRGVIHSIAGDYIFATWNIVSPCPTGEMQAFLSALELAHRFQDSFGGISVSLSSSPAIAGNFDANGQRTSVLLGPGQARCEKLELLNDYLGTHISMDENVARKISGVSLPVQNICVLPAAVYRCVTDLEKGLYEIAYSVYPSALKERHKAWVCIFRDFPTMLEADKLDEVLDHVTTFKNMYLKPEMTELRGNTAAPTPNEMAKTIDYWITFVSRLKSRRRTREPRAK